MATKFNASLLPDNSTNARIQAWATFIEDLLVSTGGWQATTETGETLPGALVAPTAGNQKRGFRCYRMTDAGPAVAMRIDFGSSSSTNTPGIWITIGAGTNGSGVITSPIWNGGASAAPNVSSNTNVGSGSFNSYGSASSDRAAFCLFVSSNPAYHLCFMIERTKNSSGGNTTDGLLLLYRDGQSTSNGLAHSRYLINAGGSQPTAENGLAYILTRQNPSETFGGDIGAGIISHFKGFAQQPGTNMLITNSSDVSSEGTISVGLYSQTRTYVQLNAFPPYQSLVGSNVIDSNARILMRYD